MPTSLSFRGKKVGNSTPTGPASTTDQLGKFHKHHEEKILVAQLPVHRAKDLRLEVPRPRISLIDAYQMKIQDMFTTYNTCGGMSSYGYLLDNLIE